MYGRTLGGGRFTIVVGRIVSVWQSYVSCVYDDDDESALARHAIMVMRRRTRVL